MVIKNITNTSAPKPIGIGNVVIMPGESAEIQDELAYVDELDNSGKKTGKKVIIPAIVLLAGMNQISYTESRKRQAKVVEETDSEETDFEETVTEEAVEKPKRTRRKTTLE